MALVQKLALPVLVEVPAEQVNTAAVNGNRISGALNGRHQRNGKAAAMGAQDSDA